jgi:ribosomal protein L19E
MKIIVHTRVYIDKVRSQDTSIEITREDIEALAKEKALREIEGLYANVLDVEVKLTL